MTFFPMVPSGNGNFERESNPMPQQVYLYLSESGFLFSLKVSNKQLFNVKSVFKFLNHAFIM